MLRQHSPHSGVGSVHLHHKLEARVGWKRTGAEENSVLSRLKAALALGDHQYGSLVEVSWVKAGRDQAVIMDEPFIKICKAQEAVQVHAASAG